jgi:hypothetical protein
MEAYPVKPNRNGHIGFAVILNNYQFYPQEKIRRGSEVDVQNITTSLTKLGFKVKAYIDLTAAKMKETMEIFAKQGDFNDFSCFVCVIMSHGDAQSQICGVDDNSVHLINDLIAPLNYCQNLIGKPKLFFVNACRGGNQAVPVAEPDSMRHVRDLDEIDALLKRKFPSDADLLIHYATVENHVSFRDTQLGSYFIQSLCHVLDTFAMMENVELAHLLREVNNKVATEFHVQMPSVCDQLRNRFYFNLRPTVLPQSR